MRTYKYNRDSRIRPAFDNYVERLIVSITAVVAYGQKKRKKNDRNKKYDA